MYIASAEFMGFIVKIKQYMMKEKHSKKDEDIIFTFWMHTDLLEILCSDMRAPIWDPKPLRKFEESCFFLLLLSLLFKWFGVVFVLLFFFFSGCHQCHWQPHSITVNSHLIPSIKLIQGLLTLVWLRVNTDFQMIFSLVGVLSHVFVLKIFLWIVIMHLWGYLSQSIPDSPLRSIIIWKYFYMPFLQKSFLWREAAQTVIHLFQSIWSEIPHWDTKRTGGGSQNVLESVVHCSKLFIDPSLHHTSKNKLNWVAQSQKALKYEFDLRWLLLLRHVT